mmetsp:Transcript_11903/g.21537  ORF Transcript_11903/g.21537 Transcript_11903/m.21537 type:complete len:262 (-) Transcript_11903:845-1630(-)|eukprot:CAMPEP_0182451884 /NCGR_PEP_ID=MMETSP1172-20130603/43956_1 /TAXON_ID=708627 /ORGANISM="Timspurckia oligopyrenoides, Strain CCMP3278" /LENGTH=261 /DNA_ID=CAMNT_0024649691 /DNA_START=56 /DNA_END=841 /DNA_ORIENTATION=+
MLPSRFLSIPRQKIPLFTRIFRSVSSSTSSAPSPTTDSNYKKYKIASAVFFERLPVILRDKLPIEIAFDEFKFNEWNRNAVSINPNILKAEPGFEDYEKQEDKRADTFTPAPRITPDDIANNTQSLNRNLQKHLYFVLKRSENARFYQFPQRLTDDNESMRESAEKALKAVVGNELSVWFIGYCPAAHYVHEYSQEMKIKNGGEFDGVKVFFYRATLISGEVKELRQGKDFRWMDADELKQYLAPDYYNAVRDALFGTILY